MKIIKYEHACFVAEQDEKFIVVDPGNWSNDLEIFNGVVAVVVTHQHADHCDQEQLAAIIEKNPRAIIIADQSVTERLSSLPTKIVTAGDKVEIAPFTLEFFGGQHATIHPDIPPIANLGVMINNAIYYSGDSFFQPDQPVDTLALPVSAPWLKISEVMDYLASVKPRLAFPTHDAILSDNGKLLVDNMLTTVAEKNGIEYRRIDVETI